MRIPNLTALYRREFHGYDSAALGQDLLAGLTVSAVALPLALAFGVASGATASAGLITAIVAGIVIGLLSGAPYQISGPTGAMSAVLLVLAGQYGLPGVWLAGLLSGVILLALGLLRLGKLLSYIPSPVITGFTAGISLVIAIGQLDNFMGIATPAATSSALKFLHYLQGGFTPDGRAVALGVMTMALMLLWPKRWQARIPSSLAALVLTLGITAISGWDVPVVGDIPRTLLPADRLTFDTIPWGEIPNMVVPAITVAVLGMVESLLCGAAAGKITGKKLDADQELIAQGIGNMVLPFFGGVPATAAIARTSVGIKSGGRTRIVGVVQSAVLVGTIFALSPIMSRIPLAALAGVLMVTALRMNEWDAIGFMLKRRFGGAAAAFFITMGCTVAMDLSRAILVGVVVSAALFLKEISAMDVQVQSVDPDRLRDRGLITKGTCRHIKVAYLTGPLFFAAVDKLNDALAALDHPHTLILSMRGVPLMDLCGVQALNALHNRAEKEGFVLMIASVQPQVLHVMEKGGLVERIGRDCIFWSADQAIVEAEEHGCDCAFLPPEEPEQAAV